MNGHLALFVQKKYVDGGNTGMCVKFHSIGIDKVSRTAGKRNGLKGCVLAAVYTVTLLALLPGFSRAELPAPKFMPGFPISAGPQVIMMWAPVPGAAKYKIYLEGKQVGETSGVQHMLPAPEKSGQYKSVHVADLLAGAAPEHHHACLGQRGES
jgi:hypothetical protein